MVGTEAAETAYTYNSLDNLTSVSQGAQTRNFAYSSLGRLLSAANPESGTISYTYDGNGNVVTRSHDGVTTSYTYDELDQLTGKSYSDGAADDPTPSVAYAYDHGWRVSTASGGTTVENTVFDGLGRVKEFKQTTDGTEFLLKYNCNLADGVTQITYPSERVVTTTYDSVGRRSSVQDVAQAVPYASGIGYTAHGAVQQMTLGNGIVENTSYNARMQVTGIQAGSLLGLQYGYGAPNNGNVRSQTIAVAGKSYVQSYSYDGVNRLSTATESDTGNGTWSQAFGYDQYGNRWVTQTTSANDALTVDVQTPASETNIDAQTNRVIGPGTYAYGDGRGNLTAFGARVFTYDAENRLRTARTGADAATTYHYDGDGRRVKKERAADTTVYVYDAFGQLAAEYATATSTRNGTEYLTADHLGSTRLVTDANGNLVSRHDYLPFGEEINEGVGGRTLAMGYAEDPYADIDPAQRFTGKERDGETGLDYFLARLYSGAQGRFTSPDPVWITPRRMLDPQELNLYAYVRNNPLRYVDPDGKILELAASSEDEARKKWALIQRGLTKQDRSHAQLVVGDGKNGFAKGHFGITVDKDYKSNSSNFQTLQGAANSKDLAIAAIVSPGDKFASNLGIQKGDTVVIATFKSQFGQDNYVSRKDAVPGQTLFHLFGSPMKDVIYSPDEASRMYVANDQAESEIVKTFFHELRHIFLGDFGRNIPRGSHPAADRDIKGIERESDRNFSGTPLRRK